MKLMMGLASLTVVISYCIAFGRAMEVASRTGTWPPVPTWLCLVVIVYAVEVALILALTK